MLRLIILILALCALNSIGLKAQVKANDIVGIWLTAEKDGRIEMYKNGPLYFGKIVWVKEPNDKNGKPKTDINNPDPNRRIMPIIGLQLVKDLEFKNGEWVNGSIYDARAGKTYSCEITMGNNPNELNLRGYVGNPFFGRTEVWTRFK